jgi:hypothetical protein
MRVCASRRRLPRHAGAEYGLGTANELGFTPIDLPPPGAAVTSDRIGRVGEQRGNRSATTVVALVACGAIVGGFASTADRPQTAAVRAIPRA